MMRLIVAAAVGADGAAVALGTSVPGRRTVQNASEAKRASLTLTPTFILTRDHACVASYGPCFPSPQSFML
ncbi:unnamed protein product [Ectocarpus fasciculatus]